MRYVCYECHYRLFVLCWLMFLFWKAEKGVVSSLALIHAAPCLDADLVALFGSSFPALGIPARYVCRVLCQKHT